MNPLAWDAPFIQVFAALFVIVTLRASATYGLGRGVVAGMSRSRFAARMQTTSYQRAVKLVSRHGAPVVAVCFLTVGFQTIVLLAAGALQMPLRRFVPALVVGATLWALVYATVGFVGFELLVRVYRYSPPLAIGLGVVLVTAFVAHVVHARRRSQRLTAEAAEDTAQDVTDLPAD